MIIISRSIWQKNFYSIPFTTGPYFCQCRICFFLFVILSIFFGHLAQITEKKQICDIDKKRQHSLTNRGSIPVVVKAEVTKTPKRFSDRKIRDYLQRV